MSLTTALLLASPAHATAQFDPTTPAAAFEGVETYDQPGELKLWSRVERLEDGDRTLFKQEAFNTAITWPEEADWAPWIDDCFGTTTPHSSAALLHMGLNESVASGTPILLIPGAGDNGVRAFVTLATRLDRGVRPVYALTFAHPHGDVYMQAEVVANAIARIKERTGAAQVDLVAHSKGGVAAAVYLSHDGGAWGDAGYDAVGTPYRGDVRRAVLVATPLGGIDTAFRWPASNLASLVADEALSPTSWTIYYQYSTLYPALNTALMDQHIGGGGADWFPGHRQLLARWDDRYALPGEQPWLGAYAMQTDWWTTYEGGQGYWSYSEGIDAAIDAGGGLLDHLAARGVDPGVELFLLAGNNPLMPNGTEDWLATMFDDTWVDLVGSSLDLWGQLVAAVVGTTYSSLGVTEGEIQGLAAGDLVLGEVTGESDGLVYVESATMAEALTARGAEVVDTHVVDLSHIDLLYASPVTGELMIESAGADPDLAWLAAVGERYIEADTLGWIEAALADEEAPGDGGAEDGGAEDGGAGDGGAGDGGAEDGGGDDTGPTAGDTGTAGADDSGDAGGDAVASGGCGRCSGLPAGAMAGWGLLLAATALLRRRR